MPPPAARYSVNSARFLLINPSDSAQKFGYVPLGAAYIAAVLESEGVFVRCLNYTMEDYDEAALRSLIIENKINFVGLSGFTPHIYSTYRIARFVKSVDDKITVFAGGPHPTVMPEEALDNGADFVVKGEAEETVRRLARRVADGYSPEKIADLEGVCLRAGGAVVNNKIPARISDLDAMPFPARHLFAGFPEKYKNMLPLNLKPGWRSAAIITSRGCSAHCVFCNKQIFGSRITYRSSENVVAEMRHLVEKYRIDEISMADDYFTADPDRVKKICRLLMDSKLGVRWACSNTRVDILDDDMYRMMKESGCYRVNYGIESAVPRIIKSIGKEITLEQVAEALRLANKHNFQIFVNFMIGHDDETPADVRSTIKYARTLPVDFIQFGINTPFPGTPLYRKLLDDGRLVTKNWRDYDYSKNVVFRPKHLSSAQIIKFYNSCWRAVTVYNPRFVWRHIRRFVFDKDTSRAQYRAAFSEFIKRIFNLKWL